MTFRFGSYELDRSRYILLRDGKPVRLERIPMELLILLAERRGELVSREEIVQRLWGDMALDAESGVNTAIRKVRMALRDNRDQPQYVEAATGKGYRFIAPLGEDGGEEAQDAGGNIAAVDGKKERRGWFSRRRVLASVAGVSMVGGGLFAVRNQRSPVTMAVLPFEDLTGAREQDYFGGGLVDETTAILGSFNPERMRVIARTSTQVYRWQARNISEIGRALGADYLVDGSVRRDSRRVRVTVTLVRVSDQMQVWAQSYDRTGAGVIEIQEELGREIARRVDVAVARARAAHRQTRDPEAYDLYLLGRYFGERPSAGASMKALGCFQAALERDPGYALAWAGVADAYAHQPIGGDGETEVYRERAKQAAEQALRLQDDLAEGQAVAGSIDFSMGWDWPSARRRMRRAIELNPNLASAHRTLAHVESNSGRHADAERAIRKARELDPLSALTLALHGQFLFQAGRYREAREPLERAIAIDPGFWIPYAVMGKVEERSGRADAAIEALNKAWELSGGSTESLSIKGWTMARAGRTTEARETLQTLIRAAADRFVPPYDIALVQEGLGERQKALEWLEMAYEVRDVRLVFLPIDPKWVEVRRTAECQDLLRRCGFGLES